jgi:phosphoesterase RecJ-like protein
MTSPRESQGSPAPDGGSLALSQSAHLLQDGRRFLITMHENPDGDALGSALGLACALIEMGREVVVYSAQGVPTTFGFLPGAERVVTDVPGNAVFDVSVACDAGHPSRLGPAFPPKPRRGVLLDLDHHLSAPPFGDVNYVDAGASAVGMLVFRLLTTLRHPISRDVATCLYVSLISDTGCFRYSNSTPECLRVAASLVEAGAEPAHIASSIYEMEPAPALALLAEVLRTLERGKCGRWASVTASPAQYALCGTSKEPSQGFVNYPRSIQGVEVAILFREEPGEVRVSLRSRGTVDVSDIAAAFGGGGHHNAAGFTVRSSLAEARHRLIPAVEAALETSLGAAAPRP